jgi:dihydroxyacetone kinase-like predicted kinase
VLQTGDSVLTDDTVKGWQAALQPEDEEGSGYDVQFLMHGDDMDIEQIRAAIDAMGWSTLVVGNERLIKVHVHVHDPGQPLSYAIAQGVSIDDVVVENMQDQYQHYVEERLSRQYGSNQVDKKYHEVAVVAVASGEGMLHLFEHELQAARMIAGGQTMNPSTQDFLAAIDILPNDKIVLLPNNKNVILAAEQAALLARDKEVVVVPSRTLPQGISAMLAYTNIAHSDNIEEVVMAMLDGLTHVRSGEITAATRDVDLDGLEVRSGEYIGLLDGNLIVADESLENVLHELLKQALGESAELITLYYGDTLDEAQARALADTVTEHFADMDLELVHGGQPLYPLIISVE